MSPSLSLAVTVTSYVFIYLDADRSFRYLMKQARICEKIEEKSLKKVFLDTAERVCKLQTSTLTASLLALHRTSDKFELYTMHPLGVLRRRPVPMLAWTSTAKLFIGAELRCQVQIFQATASEKGLYLSHSYKFYYLQGKHNQLCQKRFILWVPSLLAYLTLCSCFYACPVCLLFICLYMSYLGIVLPTFICLFRAALLLVCLFFCLWTSLLICFPILRLLFSFVFPKQLT